MCDCFKAALLLLYCCFADVNGATPLHLVRSADVCLCVTALLLLYYCHCCFTDVHGATPLHLARSAEVLISSPAEPTEYVNCLDSFFFLCVPPTRVLQFPMCNETAAQAKSLNKFGKPNESSSLSLNGDFEGNLQKQVLGEERKVCKTAHFVMKHIHICRN